jgi:glycosidase
MQLFGRGLRRRLPPMLGGDLDRLRLVYSLVFTMPGTPVLFYGEEIGMGENLDVEGRLRYGPRCSGAMTERGFLHRHPENLVRPTGGGGVRAGPTSMWPTSAPIPSRCSTGMNV